MAHEQVQGLLQFLKESPTAFHAVESICSRLTGFEPLQENARWRLQPGGRYYVTRNRSSVIAFTVPQRGFAPFQLIASHTDSPTFRIKENAELTVRDKYVQLDVERYGGMILNTWLDRPLSVAGRLAVRTQDGVRSLLVNLDEDSAVIPNVAIHMNREINTGYKYNPASDMMPLWSGGDGKGSFRARIAQAAGVAEGDIIGSDLYLYNRMPGCVWGGEGEYLSAGRLDDLECAYASLQALLTARTSTYAACLTTRKWAAAPSRARIPPSCRMCCAASPCPWGMTRRTTWPRCRAASCCRRITRTPRIPTIPNCPIPSIRCT